MKSVNSFNLLLSDRSFSLALIFVVVFGIFVCVVLLLGQKGDKYTEQWYRQLAAKGLRTEGTILSWKRRPQGDPLGRTPGSWPIVHIEISYTDSENKKHKFEEVINSLEPIEGQVGRKVSVYYLVENGKFRAASVMNHDVINAEKNLKEFNKGLH